MKRHEVFEEKMRTVIPRVVIAEARRTNTKIVIWDEEKKKVKHISPDEAEQMLDEKGIVK